MKQIYDFQQKIFIKGQTHDFMDTSIWHHYCLLSDEEVVQRSGRWTFRTFDDLWRYLEEMDAILNTKHWTNCFGVRKVRFSLGLMDHCTISEKRYHEVTLWHYMKEEEKVSLNTLMENLPADDMVEYLRERGLGIENRG